MISLEEQVCSVVVYPLQDLRLNSVPEQLAETVTISNELPEESEKPKKM